MPKVEFYLSPDEEVARRARFANMIQAVRDGHSRFFIGEAEIELLDQMEAEGPGEASYLPAHEALPQNQPETYRAVA